MFYTTNSITVQQIDGDTTLHFVACSCTQPAAGRRQHRGLV